MNKIAGYILVAIDWIIRKTTGKSIFLKGD